MKKTLTLFSALFLLFMTACTSRNSAITDELASFAVFLRNFTSDADYQKAHIRFPLGIAGRLTAIERQNIELLQALEKNA